MKSTLRFGVNVSVSTVVLDMGSFPEGSRLVALTCLFDQPLLPWETNLEMLLSEADYLFL